MINPERGGSVIGIFSSQRHVRKQQKQTTGKMETMPGANEFLIQFCHAFKQEVA